MKLQPLTEAELDRVSVLLARFVNKRSMNLEQLDGFFAALISGPQIVPPSDYLPVICGDEMVLRDTANAPAATGNAVFPTTVSPKYSGESAGKARMQTCPDQYRANKGNGANGGLKWIEKGGRYYSQCKRLKGAA